ncbi:nucleotidyltransferase domain-containing protein [Sorangium sp. So ce327]|jgi:hypothetical protein|uniref:nucleotidyltransferase domain-containing protein n=1 Tax=Sorangium sp. So ce327 TaxID=3133301 RepID=UPI003F60EB61
METDTISGHRLHAASDAAVFRSRFEAATGRTIDAVLSDFVDPAGIVLIALGGSIPLGIATEASDIDLLVLLRSPDCLRMPRAGTPHVLFAGNYASSDELAIATAVVRSSNVEMDVQFLLTEKISQLLGLLKTSRVALSFQQRQLLARLRRAWPLSPEAWPSAVVDLPDESFDIHCAVQSMITSYRSLVDARVAAEDSFWLALAMGRHSVEKAFEAYFASRGYSYLGLKWLRFLERRWSDMTGVERGRLPAPVAVRGRELLFPVAAPEEVLGYLTRVEELVGDVRRVLDSNLRFRLALDVSPFVARPRIISGGRP